MHGSGTCVSRGAYVAGEMTTAVDGKHPTGMHSFFFLARGTSVPSALINYWYSEI